MNKRFLFCLLCIVFLFLSIENLLARNQAKPLPADTLKGPDIGTIVKGFSLQTTDGETFTLSDYKGKIVIFEFVSPTCIIYLSRIPEMDKIAEDFKDKGVISYFIYTWKPPKAGQSMNQRIKNKKTMTMTGTRPSKEKRNLDFSDTEETETHQEPIDIALEIMKRYNKKRPILIDTLCPDCIQRTLGGGIAKRSPEPGRLTVIDREGKVALWQSKPNVKKLRAKLEEMTEK